MSRHLAEPDVLDILLIVEFRVKQLKRFHEQLMHGRLAFADRLHVPKQCFECGFALIGALRALSHGASASSRNSSDARSNSLCMNTDGSGKSRMMSETSVGRLADSTSWY